MIETMLDKLQRRVDTLESVPDPGWAAYREGIRTAVRAIRAALAGDCERCSGCFHSDTDFTEFGVCSRFLTSPGADPCSE